MSLYIDISTIPKKKEVGEQHEIEFFSEASLKILLEQPDCEKKNGVRDLMFMILLYDTGARVQEILDIRLKDLHIDEHTPYVTVTGKGSKTRIVPLMMKTCEHLEKYIRRFHSEANLENYLFYTERKGKREQMSVDNVEKFITKYATKAHAIFPESPEHIYPHMWRHSRAMHLYRNGMSSFIRISGSFKKDSRIMPREESLSVSDLSSSTFLSASRAFFFSRVFCSFASACSSLRSVFS